MHAVTGISDHIGWAEFVTIGVQDEIPVILDRRRVELIQAGIPSAPYHHEGLALPRARVEAIIERTRKSIAERCRTALTQAKSAHGILAIALQQSPMDRLPNELSEILASYKITCAADGMMYREMLADIGKSMGLKVSRYPRRSDEIAAAAAALGTSRATVAEHIAALGRHVGPPWRREHQVAAASALRVLAKETSIRLSALETR
jgi:hypothetical protein